MIDSMRHFILDSLVETNIGDNSQPRRRGGDPSSLSLAEFALRGADEYGLKFGEEETEKLAGLTVGEFCALVAERTQAWTLVE